MTPIPAMIGVAAKLAKSKSAKKVFKGVVGAISGKKDDKKKRRFSLQRYAKRLLAAKMNAKIQKARLSAFRGL